MRHLVLLLLLLSASCRETAGTAPVFLDDLARAPLLRCAEHDATAMPGSVTELSRSGDSAVVALFGDARTVLLLNDRLGVLRRLELRRDGPHGIADATSILAHGDSLVMADAEGEQLVVFDWDGNRRGAIGTDFAPLQVVDAGDRIAIVPAVVGRFPGTLLFSLRDGAVHREEVAVIDFPDLTIKALGNRVRLLPVRDALVLLHQFFTPRALYIRSGVQQSLRVPLASALKSAVGYVPPLPLTDDALEPALVVANDAAPAENNQLLLLVRTGTSFAGKFEKAIIRTDSMLNFLAAHRLPVGPGLMTYLPRSRMAVLVDEEDRWFTCRLP